MSKKMKNCKTCGKPLAANAKTCPECGAKNKKPIYKRVWFIILIVVVIIAVIAAIGGGGEEEITYEPATAVEMIKAYEENEVSADELYNDKYLEISGTVGSIEKGITDDAYITLENTEDEWGLTSVQCFFEDEEQIAKLADCKEGDQVVIKGKCTGITLNVIVDECQLVE